jgi:hypothetical protein
MIVKKHGEQRLSTVAKLHFKTTKAVLSPLAGGRDEEVTNSGLSGD